MPNLAQVAAGALVTLHMCFDSTFNLKQLSGKNKVLFSPRGLVADLERAVFVKCTGTGHLRAGQGQVEAGRAAAGSLTSWKKQRPQDEAFPLPAMVCLCLGVQCGPPVIFHACPPASFVLCPATPFSTCLSREVPCIFSVRLCFGAKVRNNCTMYVSSLCLLYKA